MLFKDYYKILKSFLAEGASNEDFCMLLFNSVIGPMDLKTKDGEIVYYSKSRISEIINGKVPVPAAIRDNVYNTKVQNTIIEYFKRNIVSRLSPNFEDLCFQLISLIEDDDKISPSSKELLKSAANPSYIEVFLAQTFSYAVRGDIAIPYNTNKKNEDVRKPDINLFGIIGNQLNTDEFSIETFKPNSEVKMEDRIEKIKYIYQEISNIHVEQVMSVFSFAKGWSTVLDDEMVKISEDRQKELSGIAGSLEVDIPEDFFELGNLHRNPIKRLNAVINGGDDLEGSEPAKKKYKLFNHLENELSEFAEMIPIYKAFSKYSGIRLAVNNCGNTPDEDIVIRLELEAEGVLLPKDFLDNKRETVEDLLNDFDLDMFFHIKESKDYLAYEASIIKSKHPLTMNNHYQPFPRKRHWSKEDAEKELKDAIGYNYIIDGDNVLITIKFDEIMHNTTVAFPTMIFVKKDIEKIKYTIRSRKMENIYTGIIHNTDLI